ncbi:MAG: hypothetical protein HOP29_17585 [Phycisphaerales bacterium]|nr:hypothetical protein [Phycisphaerales bacterium]
MFRLALVAFACACPTLKAQEPIKMDEEIKPGLFHIRRMDAYLEMEAGLEQHRVRSQDGSGRTNARQTNRTASIYPIIGLTIDGDMVHPHLFDFSGSLGVGYTESRFREERLDFTDADRSTGFLHEFDLRADFLKTKPLSGGIYGTRRDDRIGRLFLPSLREVRTEWGSSWSLRHDVFPIRFSFDRVDTDRTGNRDEIDDERIRQDRLRLGGDWKIDEHHRVTYEYEHARTQQKFQGGEVDFDTTRDVVRLEHELEFGADYRHRLFTVFRYQEETGDLAEDLFEIRPELTLKHSEELSTRFSYDGRRERYDGLEVELHRFDAELRHQFRKELTTVFNFYGLEERTDDDVETSQGGGSVDWHYGRDNALGRFTGELGLAFDSERTRGDGGLRAVRNESGTFRDPLPVYLTRAHVVPISLRVTDLTGTLVYQAGLDFAATRTADRVALFRLASGRIANGQTVLIDYYVETPADGSIDTLRMDFGLQQAFESGLTPYYRFNYRNQEADASQGFDFIADRTNHHRMGVTYTRPQWSAQGEFEIFDDTIDPYDAFRIGGGWVVVRSDRQLFDVRLDFGQYLFVGGELDREVSEINLSARHECRLNDFWTSTVHTTWRWEDDSVRGTTNGLDLEGILAYRRGNMAIEFTLEYDLLRIAGSREDSVGAWINLRWDMEDIARME